MRSPTICCMPLCQGYQTSMAYKSSSKQGHSSFYYKIRWLRLSWSTWIICTWTNHTSSWLSYQEEINNCNHLHWSLQQAIICPCSPFATINLGWGYSQQNEPSKPMLSPTALQFSTNMQTMDALSSHSSNSTVKLTFKHFLPQMSMHISKILNNIARAECVRCARVLVTA